MKIHQVPTEVSTLPTPTISLTSPRKPEIKREPPSWDFSIHRKVDTRSSNGSKIRKEGLEDRGIRL